MAETPNEHEQAAMKTIASYVVGRHVPDAELSRARDRLASNSSYIEALSDTLGISDALRVLSGEEGLPIGREADCRVFGQLVDEFAQASHQERLEMYPDLIEHHNQCLRCQWLLDDSKLADSFWHLPDGEAVLRSALTLQASSSLGVRWRAQGPIPLEPPVRLAADDPGKPKEQRWELRDTQADILISIEVIFNARTGQPDVLLESRRISGAAAVALKITVRDTAQKSGIPAVDGLSPRANVPVISGYGNWELLMKEEQGERVWRMRIDLVKQDPEQNDPL